MSDQIQKLIASIREKFSQVKGQLSAEQSKNEKLQNEMEELKSQLDAQNDKVNSLENELQDAKSNKNDLSEQNITSSEGTMITEGQIDELVKEIDYCIGQLKK
ncbi:MAG: hypothetical protein COA33_012825 [Fluviicola sp.]|nr:hypothetical protein [Fluviicola sp.]